MSAISRAYGKAAFDYALSQNQLEEWLLFANNLTGFMHPALKNPTLTADAVLSAFKDHVSKDQYQWLALMQKKKHLRLLSDALNAFKDHFYQHNNMLKVHITVAKPLSKQEKVALEDKLEKRMQKKIVSAYTTDPALIGGIQINFQGSQIDQSLQYVLKQLSTEI